ncbi:hypothetical protein FQN50_001402 [Emmonsiellopsis sp. PD_5]|nr:hypothetical protein FQN50_001402 [Emmonsiellopsis sp. PD_5]
MSWLYPFARSSHSSSKRRRSRDRHSSSSHHSHSHSHSHSRHGRSSPSPSLFSLSGYANNRSTASSIFSLGSSSSSSRRAKPRSGFISRMVRRIRRLFRDIMHYAKKHPMKVFVMVIMPLITGGVLQKMLGVVGIRLPPSLGGLKGGQSKGGRSGGGIGDLMGGGGGGIGDSVGGLVSLAKMFV